MVNYWNRLNNDFWGVAKDNFRENLKNLIPGRAAYKLVLEPQIDRTVDAWRASKAVWQGDYYESGRIAGGQAAGATVELGTLALGAGVGKAATSGFGNTLRGLARNAAKGVTAPKGWIKQASKKGGGTVFKDPSNPHNMIRQMPGNPNSPNVLQQKPYVKFMKEGKFYDVNGNVLPNGNVPGAHIPLDQFDISKMPKF